MSLSPENTIAELFSFFDRGDNPVQVVPITIKQQTDDTQLMICIHGEHEMASVIMAELMTTVTELYDMQAQAEAEAVEDDGEPESRIITG